ncbi:hypothetical protein X729_24070 [Mesorhizobium sp. L103C131B0]|nr:hypothetical protein X729_24070 [Mesorhizobium sp. L103C131B0]
MKARQEREKVLSWASTTKVTCFELNDGHHLKIDDFNFFPSRGTITRDGGTKVVERGAEAFIKLVSRQAQTYPSLTGQRRFRTIG